MPIAIVYVCWYYLRPVGGASCFLFYFILLFFDDGTPLYWFDCSSSMRCHVLSFATIYRGSISLFAAYGCGEIVGRSVLLWYIYPNEVTLSITCIIWRGILEPPICWSPARLPLLVPLYVVTNHIYFTLPLLLTYSRLLQFLHTRIPTLLELTLNQVN